MEHPFDAFFTATIFTPFIGYFIARKFWFLSLPVIIRLPVFGLSALVMSAILSVLSGIAGMIVRGTFPKIFDVEVSEYPSLLSYIFETGAVGGAGSLIGVAVWSLLALGGALLRVYRTRHDPGGILNRERIEKKWRVALFAAGIWMSVVFCFAMFSDYYGRRMGEDEVLSMLFMMTVPALLGLCIMWIYESFVK